MNHDEPFKTLHQGLKASFEEGSMEREEFRKEAERCWAKRAKLAAEHTTINRQRAKLVKGLNDEKSASKPDWAAAYAEILTNLYKPHERSSGWETRNDYTHSAWRQHLIERYDSEDPGLEGVLWCPITRMYLQSEICTAAHIVPQSIGCSNAGHIFGEGDNGFGVIWSPRNGIMMTTWFESHFDKGDFVLVPVEPANPELEPCEWRFVLMNEKLRRHRVGGSESTYDDLDGRLLEWQNDNRPARRFLYYHFVTTLLRYVRYEKPGWAEKRMMLPTGKLWATQGPYLRRSTLKYLALTLGDVEDGDKMFADGVFDQKDNKPESEERLMAQEIFVAQECPKLDQEAATVEASKRD
ncbi:MAG: hypothetical protein LQ347_006600 [Umbilicaria vellea]|nr:MAG: hypothetical protein LQ347_006600 [Umbilicaria vellea]